MHSVTVLIHRCGRCYHCRPIDFRCLFKWKSLFMLTKMSIVNHFIANKNKNSSNQSSITWWREKRSVSSWTLSFTLVIYAFIKFNEWLLKNVDGKIRSNWLKIEDNECQSISVFFAVDFKVICILIGAKTHFHLTLVSGFSRRWAQSSNSIDHIENKCAN